MRGDGHGSICIGFAAVLLLNAAVHWVYRVATVGLETFVTTHMPLHICGITALVLAYALAFRSRRAFEVAYFWGLAGTANAVLTPQLDVGFPGYLFFQFFIAHGGIVAGVLFATWGVRMRPTFAGLMRAYGLLAVLACRATGRELRAWQQLHVSERAAAVRVALLLRPLAVLHSGAGGGWVRDVPRAACAVPGGGLGAAGETPVFEARLLARVIRPGPSPSRRDDP